MGLQMRQLLTTFCVTSSLTPVALGGSDPTGGFCLRAVSFGRPHGNRETICDTVAVSRNVEDASYKESGDA
jgi:hypothetical protein